MPNAMVKQTNPHTELEHREHCLVLLHLPQLPTNFTATAREVFRGVKPN